jgi:hypothetical protein
MHTPDLAQRTRSKRLPPELTDAIIDMLHDNRAALAACALVCRSWVPASRRHLFSQVAIAPNNCTDAANLLSSVIGTIAPAVQNLMLNRVDSLIGLREITGTLSNVRHLSLQVLSRHETWISSLPVLVPILQCLQSLHLRDIEIKTPDVLLLLMRNSPQLRSISFDTVLLKALLEYSAPQNDQDLLMPTLETLRICMAARLMGWLAGRWASAAPRLTMLDMNLYPSSSVKPPLRMLEAVGSSLEIFRLSDLGDKHREWHPTVTLAYACCLRC